MPLGFFPQQLSCAGWPEMFVLRQESSPCLLALFQWGSWNYLSNVRRSFSVLLSKSATGRCAYLDLLRTVDSCLLATLATLDPLRARRLIGPRRIR